MLKAVFPVILIISNKTLKRYNEIVFGGVHLVIIVGYIVCTWKLKPYNYARMNLWQIMLSFAAFWIGVLSGLDSVLPETNQTRLTLMILLILGWAF